MYRNVISNPAPSPDHESLKVKLRQFAIAKGYHRPARFAIPRVRGPYPDAMHCLDDDDGTIELFIGDAKVARHERAGRSLSVRRLSNYFSLFGRALSSGEISGGMLAVITDDREAAREWVPTLNGLADEHDVYGPRGGLAQFKVNGYRGAYIVAW